MNEELFSRTGRVTLELSNRCNYVGRHKECPASTFKDVRILPLDVIKHVVLDLQEAGWGDGKYMAFHVFNEPGIDPRLYWLIEYVTKELSGVKPILITNGWYLNETLAEELLDAGLHSLVVSGYTRSERHRLRGVNKLPGAKVEKAQLKQSILTPGDGPDSYRDCHAPLNDLTIRASGNVGLCCIDHAETVVFGNVLEESLTSILRREWERMRDLQFALIRRVRTLPVCKTCWRRRKKFK